MFHLTLITKDAYPSLQEIQEVVQQHPRRNFRVDLEGYAFQVPEIEQLIHDKCGVCIKKDNNFSDAHIKSFIDLGKSTVLVHSQNYELQKLLDYLELGATTLVGLTEDFDLFQISELVTKGKERTLVLVENLEETHAEQILEKGGSLIVNKGTLSPFAVTRLVKLGENRVIIDAAGFSDFRIKKFMEHQGIIHFGEGNLIAMPTIEEYIINHPEQIYLNAAHFSFDPDWVDRMEALGATVV